MLPASSSVTVVINGGHKCQQKQLIRNLFLYKQLCITATICKRRLLLLVLKFDSTKQNLVIRPK